MAEATYGAALAECSVQRLAERESYVFGGMVLVHVQIALCLDGEVEASVARQTVEHVVEEPDSGADVSATRAVQVEDHLNLTLARLTSDMSRSRRVLHSVGRMVTAGSARAWLGPFGIAACAVAPLMAASVWSGFRLATADQVLAVLSPSEDPLTIRTAPGVWLWCLVLAWFACAYYGRAYARWEPLLVIVGVGVALLRAGNAWFAAVLLLAPLARQVRRLCLPLGAVLAVASAAFAAALVLLTRPPALPEAARQAASTLPARRVLADWRWAGALDGQARPYASHGLSSESIEFWVDYLRVSQGHAQWQAVLDRLDVDVLVLDAADQQAQAAALVRASDAWRVVLDTSTVLVAQRTR